MKVIESHKTGVNFDSSPVPIKLNMLKVHKLFNRNPKFCASAQQKDT